jgi:2-iminobutanoate/2-iminopropanoate deaminase
VRAAEYTFCGAKAGRRDRRRRTTARMPGARQCPATRSRATPSPLYHKHPHELHEHDHPNDIGEQTRRALSAIKSILDQEGLVWTDIVKVTKYVTDMRDMDGMVAVLKQTFGDWTPASTTVCVNQLSTPGARIELDMIAAYRKA